MKSFVFVSFVLSIQLMSAADFIDYQLSFSRVIEASVKNDSTLQKLFEQNQLNFPPKQIYIRAFKQEQTLEVWATDDVQYKIIKTYNFAATSGKLGPKQKEGDLQIPEGFYQVETFNPESKFHLSFKLNYPNFADAVRNKKEQNLGGDIYIHGSNQTIGCIPLGDSNISELYWLCVKSFALDPLIPIHVFPCKMEEEKLIKLYKEYPAQINFWNSIKPMYQFFQSHKMLGEVTSCDSIGNYQLAIPWD